MSFNSSFKFLVTCGAVFAFAFCFVSDAHAQRGFRIGNVMQAGGGQGFRLGGQRAGMHFGGGQGTSIGTQNFGMRFGNGQGARFGGGNYGMQFGGQQGTQIGQFATQPSVAPGTYYYGDAQRGSSQPMAAQPFVRRQPLVRQQTYAIPGQSAMIPTVAVPNAGVIQTQANLDVATTPVVENSLELAPPNSSTGNTGNGTQLDLAALANEAAKEKTETSEVTATVEPQAPAGIIRLRYPDDATGDFNYSINGTPLTLAPGESFIMMTGNDWKLNFSAGDAFGDRVAEISEAGNYVFEMTDDEGWVIVDDSPAENTEIEETIEVEETTEVPAIETPAAEAVVPTIEAPSNPTEPSIEIELDAPASSGDGNSVLDTTEEIDESDIAPPASPNDK